MATSFVEVYNRFLNQITDDLYVELTLQDTLKDLQTMLIEALPLFEFPRKNLFNYSINTIEMNPEEVTKDDFVVQENYSVDGEESVQSVLVERSSFEEDLTQEEIFIISKIMLNAWLQRQITSIENTRMKYSGTDFKMTSQANHLSKLINLQDKVKQEIHHFQRLYRRRRLNDENMYESNWDIFRKTNYWYDD